MGAHGITKSQMFEDSDLDNTDFKMEIDETANKELKRRIFELNQELDVLKKEKKEMEMRMNDDDVIVRSEIETIGKDDDDNNNNEYTTPMGADPNSVVALQMSEKPIEEQQGFIDYKNEMSEKMERLEDERNELEKSKQNIENKVGKMENEI